MPWLALELEVDAAAADALSDALLEAGAQSVCLDALETAKALVNVLLPLDAQPQALLARAAGIAGLPVVPAFNAARVEDEDWVRRSQAQFAPLQVGERLWVGPTWCEAPPGVARVRLDPGLAFGTGSHPTTRLVLEFLERSIRGGERVLDYGCGSGILAIAAAKLGASQVDAVDIDPQAVLTATGNAAANGVGMRIALAEELAPAEYDVVVSNILAQPLIVLAPLLASHASRGGRIALAGVLSGQAGGVAAAYAPYFDAAASAHAEGWALIEGVRK